MPDSLAPVTFPSFTEVEFVTATNTYQPSYNAQPVQIATLGAGGLTRPTTGQVYPRGDQ